MDLKIFQWMATSIVTANETEKKLNAAPVRSSSKKKPPTESEQKFAASIRRVMKLLCNELKDSPELEAYVSVAEWTKAVSVLQSQLDTAKKADEIRKADFKKSEENLEKICKSLTQDNQALKQDNQALKHDLEELKICIQKSKQDIETSMATKQSSLIQSSAELARLTRGVDALIKASPVAKKSGNVRVSDDFQGYVSFKVDVEQDAGNWLTKHFITTHTLIENFAIIFHFIPVFVHLLQYKHFVIF